MSKAEDARASKAPSNKDKQTDTEKMSAMIQQLLRPLLDFHAETDDASDDDLRMYWDVRLVRGSGRPFLHTSGTTTISAALSGSAARMLPNTLGDEVYEKIAKPLVSKAQDMIGPIELERMVQRDVTRGLPAAGETRGQPFTIALAEAVEVSQEARKMGEVRDV